MEIKGIITSSYFDNMETIKLIIRNANRLEEETISEHDHFSQEQLKLHLIDKLKYYENLIDIAQEKNRNSVQLIQHSSTTKKRKLDLVYCTEIPPTKRHSTPFAVTRRLVKLMDNTKFYKASIETLTD